MTRIVIILVAAAAAVAPLLLVDQTFFVQTALAAIVVTGLSLFMGYAGQASLGQGAFVAVGGLTVAVGTVSLGIPPLVALVLAPVLGAAAAALVGWPLLRLRGHYLAFGSLAVLLIIQTVMATVPLFGAGVGIFGVPPLSVGGLIVTDQRVYSYLALAGLALALVVCRNLVRSRFGRGIRALAGSESAAASSGVPVLRSKLTVFAVAGAFAGFAGALGAFFTPYVSQDTFPPFVSFGYVVMAVVGGLGSVWGGVVGTLALSLWLQVLSTLSATPGMPAAAGPILQYAGYGVVLVLFLLFVPRGIVPTVAGRWAALRATGPRVRGGGEPRAAGSRARWGRSGEPVRADRAERD